MNLTSKRPDFADVNEVVRSLSPTEKRNYSYTRAINSLCSEQFESCLETELSHDFKRVMGKTQHGPKSIFVPLSISERSGLDTKTGAAGGFLAATDVGNVIDLLFLSSDLT